LKAALDDQGDGQADPEHSRQDRADIFGSHRGACPYRVAVRFAVLAQAMSFSMRLPSDMLFGR
jgi:hypothetical protein